MTRDEFVDKIAKASKLTLETKGLSNRHKVSMLDQNATALIGAQLCDLEATLKAGLAEIAEAVKEKADSPGLDALAACVRPRPESDP